MSEAALVVSVVDTRTRVSHLVGVDTAALHRRSGRYPTLCDSEVITASLTTAPKSTCDACADRTAPQLRAPGRSAPRGWWRRARRVRP